MDRISLLLRSNISKQLLFACCSSSYRSAQFYSTCDSKNERYTRVQCGIEHTKSFRIYLKNSRNQIVSPFHDVPLAVDANAGVYNMVVEIPRWTQAKMEINKAEKLNPITQDIKKGRLRFVNNIFPYHGYIWNYGALPQTWEDPNVKDETTGMMGDNDPLDVCEVGSRVHERGSVVQVKVLGALGLIDEGEADWKIITVDIDDPLAARLNDIGDVEKHMPGLLDATRDWFRVYKIPTGKPANIIVENGRFFEAKFAQQLIRHDHERWLALMRSSEGKTAKISLLHTNKIEGAAQTSLVEVDEANRIVDVECESAKAEASSLNKTEVDTIHFVDRTKI